MPTPLGHALGGFVAGWLVAGPERASDASTAGRHPLLRPALFVAAGVAADFDLLVGRHHQFTHSIGAALIVLALALIALRRRREGLLLALAVAAAYASHPLLDWLGEDSTPPRGITALWPFSEQYYLSHADLFRGISREPWRPGVIWHDLLAIVGEVVVLAPLAVGAWWLRRPGPPAQNLPVRRGATGQPLPSAPAPDHGGESRLTE